MTIVNIELVPKTIAFRIVSSKAEHEEKSDEFERFLMLVGQPKYTGTYKYTDIELVRGGRKVIFARFSVYENIFLTWCFFHTRRDYVLG
jgi:hypothetical protein